MPRRFAPVLGLVLLAGVPACQLFKPEPPLEPVPEITEPKTQFAELPRLSSPQTTPPTSSITVVHTPASPLPPEPVPQVLPLPRVTVPETPIQPTVAERSTPDPPLVAAVRAYLQDRPDQAVEHLNKLDPSNQELLLQLIPAVVRASQLSATSANSHEIGLLMRELQGAAQSLALRGPLFIDKAVFLRSVKGFGRYDPLPERPTFKPGTNAGLYVEIGNVPSVASDAEGFVTHLSCSLQVRDSHGNTIELADPSSKKPVESVKASQREVTRSPVRDYFVVCWFPVPSKPGSYTVSLEVRDLATGRATSKSVPFRVQ